MSKHGQLETARDTMRACRNKARITVKVIRTLRALQADPECVARCLESLERINREFIAAVTAAAAASETIRAGEGK